MEKQEMINALNDELKAFKENLPEYATQEDLTNKLASIQEQVNNLGIKEDLSSIQDAVEKQGLALQKIQSEQPKADKKLGDYLAEKSDDLAKLAKGDINNISMTLKTTAVRASVTDHTLAMRLPDVGQLDRQQNVLAPLFRQGRVGANSNGVIRYVDQASITNNAAATAEGVQKPESAITWQEYTLAIQKIADTIPVSMEMFNDVAFVESELRRLLEVNLAVKEDGYLWDGTGVAPQITGIYTAAPEYVAVASGITDASIYDLIVKMKESIVSGSSKYRPNYAIMNIADINKMKLKKDGNNNYVMPPFVSQDGMVVDGIQIVESASVTADTMLVGDFNYATRYILDDITIKMGWIDKQFVQNTMTLLAEIREGLLVRNADADGFAKETGIAAALVTLATP
jgi:HK97 family phage major capsid protein